MRTSPCTRRSRVGVGATPCSGTRSARIRRTFPRGAAGGGARRALASARRPARKLLQMVHSSPIGAVRFDEHGLVPCVTQNWRTGEVLTLAYMNDEALERTRATGEMWFWSRSRQELWHKGETSGNVQRLKELRFDCDDDAILALVEPAGPACH